MNTISDRRRTRYSLCTDGLLEQTSPRERECGAEIFPSDRFHRPIVLRLQNARKRLALQASARDYRTNPRFGGAISTSHNLPRATWKSATIMRREYRNRSILWSGIILLFLEPSIFFNIRLEFEGLEFDSRDFRERILEYFLLSMENLYNVSKE